MFRFKFKQSDYGDVCTLINIINVLDYMHDEDSVSRLKYYLDESKWVEYQQTHDLQCAPGYRLSAVMQLLQRKCHYRQKRHSCIPVGTLLKQKIPIAVEINPQHCITIFESMIFDANDDETKPATKANLNLYINPSEKLKNPVGNYRNASGIKFYTFSLDKKKTTTKGTLSATV